MDRIVAAGRRLIGTAFGCAGAEPRPNVIQETPENSDDEEPPSDDSGPNSPVFLFKTTPSDIGVPADAQNGRDQYMSSVLNWSTAGFFGLLEMNQLQRGSSSQLSRKDATLQHISIGVHNVQDIMEVIQNAADSAGFSVYSHKGARVLGNRCTIKFGCDHGRKRYGKDDVRETKVLQKDLDAIVKDSCRKKRATRLNDGFKPAERVQSRLKSTECAFQFSIIAYQHSTTFTQTMRTDWHLCSHGNCKNNFTHSSHTWRGSKIIMSLEAKKYILDHCSLHSVQSICVQVQRIYNLDLTLSRMRWFISSNGQTAVNKRQDMLHGQSGDAMASIRQLIKTKNSQVIILAIDVTNGEQSTIKASLSATENAIDFEVTTYDSGVGISRPMMMTTPDPDRVIHVHGTCFFVHSQVWNYLDDTKLFAAYPHVIQMDAQANVNRTTDGFNVVGVCGNYHNIVLLRSFIGDQRAVTFRWIFDVAFLYLLGKAVLNRVRLILVDGCTAVIGELQALCQPHGLFGSAKLLRCIFHLLIDSWDRQFGHAMQEPWFKEYKQYLFRLRCCESIAEFQLCADYVMRKAAGCDNATFPAISVIKFIMQRVRNAEDWVLYSHIHTCTRGCLATSRCESEHGHSRNAGVNARCSWALAISRYEGIRAARKTRLMRWIRRQLDGTLARGPTNPDDTTLSANDLTGLDSELLPWLLDTFEEQALLGRVLGMRCIYVETAAGASDKVVFAVYFEDADQEEAIAADRARTRPGNSDSEESGEGSEDDAPGSAKRLCTVQNEDNVTNEDETWTDEMQKELEELVESPLTEEMKFVYKRVRRVAFKMDPRDPSKMIISCNCGFPNRIGCACRHILCVIFTVLKQNRVDIDGHSVTSLCSCTSSPRTCTECMRLPHHKEFEWDNFDLRSLVNLDIGSKVKYHATLQPNFDSTSLFPAIHDGTFFPRIAASIMHKFARNNDVVDPHAVPKIGIPDANSAEISERGSSPAPPPTGDRRRHAVREEVPTLPRLVSDLERIWARTERLKDSKLSFKRTEARKIMLAAMRSMDDQVSSLHPDLEPKRMQRYFSRRDYYLGNAHRRDD